MSPLRRSKSGATSQKTRFISLLPLLAQIRQRGSVEGRIHSSQKEGEKSGMGAQKKLVK